MTIEPEESKAKRQRSPAYPCVGLADAIKLAGQFWEKEKRHPALVGVASQHFGYKAGSSTGLQLAAALTYFGLMEQLGTKESRSVKLTELAIAILSTPESPARDAFLKQAALKPSIHAELLNKYGGDLPSNETLRRYLTFERGFNDGSVDEFIRQFNDTLEFAKVLKSSTRQSANNIAVDNVVLEVGAATDMHETERQSDQRLPGRVSVARNTKVGSQAETDPTETERLRFNLKGGRRVRLMFTGHLPTQADIEKLIANLELNKDTFPETIEDEQ